MKIVVRVKNIHLPAQTRRITATRSAIPASITRIISRPANLMEISETTMESPRIKIVVRVKNIYPLLLQRGPCRRRPQ